jgi:hypothetical protein
MSFSVIPRRELLLPLGMTSIEPRWTLRTSAVSQSFLAYQSDWGKQPEVKATSTFSVSAIRHLTTLRVMAPDEAREVGLGIVV